MKKIDLHLHTKKMNSSEMNRNIPDINEFINIMEQAEIGVCAITNHNHFDDVQFDNIVEKIKEKKIELLVLPGVELDVFISSNSKNKKQLNIIANISKKQEIKNFLIDNNISAENPIALEEVVEKFGIDDNYIFYLDTKSEYSFKQEEIQNLFLDNEKFKTIYILDVNNISHFRILRGWKEKCLIGSDNSDWKSYVSNHSKDLAQYCCSIPNFEILYKIFKEKGISTNIFRETHLVKDIVNVEIKDKDKDKLICKFDSLPIVLYNTNIIFGPKSTGKSELLSAFFNKIEVDESKKIIHHVSENLKCEKVMESIVNSNLDDFHDQVDAFKSYLNFLKKYNEEIAYRKTLKDFFCSIETEKNKKYSLINFKILPIEENKDQNIIISDLLNSYKKIISNLKQLELYKWENSSDIKIIKDLFFNTINKRIQINTPYWKQKFLIETQECLKTLFKLHKDITANVQTFGMKKIFEIRKKAFENRKKILETFIPEKLILFVKKIQIPIENSNEKSEWMFYKKLKKNWDSSSWKRSDNIAYATDIKKMLTFKFLSPIVELAHSLSRHILDTKDYFTIERIIKNSNDVNKKPSSGELAFIQIYSTLWNEDYDYYFLDEPEMHLNNKFISNIFLPQIQHLISMKKTIIISTHNSVLGVNTFPANYILRESQFLLIGGTKVHLTWNGDLVENKMYNVFNRNEFINTKEKILEYFEGSRELYDDRSNIYGEK